MATECRKQSIRSNPGRAARLSRAGVLASWVLVAAMSVTASNLDKIGVTLLRQTTTNLNGAGIRVAQPEASLSTNAPVFEIDPAAVGQPVSLFTYYSTNGTSTNFPNAVGEVSHHANAVAGILFGTAEGIATNIAHVDNFDADYFINTYIDTSTPPDPGARIINQSFTFGALDIPVQQEVDKAFDRSAALYNALFISGADNGGEVKAPATAYNGIGVGAVDGGSGTGPTPDNGRCKPDIVAYGGFTSAATPMVSGSAALLLQAALRGDGGADTNAASDMRVLKALLLNGALKPDGWTNGPTTPLDARYGAGIVNAFNAYGQLAGGQHGPMESSTVTTNSPHPPMNGLGASHPSSGWDYRTLTSSGSSDRINYYYFDVSNGMANTAFTFTASLVWNRQVGQNNINDLDLYLYDTANSNLVAESISFVDNVEHLYVRQLPPGRYNLQVWKAGGSAANGRISNGETYALAWDWFAVPLAIERANGNVVLSWPVYPTGFTLESSTNQGPAYTWSPVNTAPAVTNGTNYVVFELSGQARLFRLSRP